MNMNQENIINEMRYNKAKAKAHQEKIKVLNRDIKALKDIKRKHSKENNRLIGIVEYLAECLQKETQAKEVEE
jgi:hypothetical protein